MNDPTSALVHARCYLIIITGFVFSTKYNFFFFPFKKIQTIELCSNV